MQLTDERDRLAAKNERLREALKGLVVAWENNEPMHRGDPQSFADPIGQARAALAQSTDTD